MVLLGVPQEDKAAQRLRKEAQVTLYRSYRMGDFPDIQISYSSLITPLQALAQVRLPLLCVLPTKYFKYNEYKQNINPKTSSFDHSEWIVVVFLLGFFSVRVPSERSNFSQTAVQLPVCWYPPRNGETQTKRGEQED